MSISQLENLMIGCKELYIRYDYVFNCGYNVDMLDIDNIANTLRRIDNTTTKREYKRLLKHYFNWYIDK